MTEHTMSVTRPHVPLADLIAAAAWTQRLTHRLEVAPDASGRGRIVSVEGDPTEAFNARADRVIENMRLNAGYDDDREEQHVDDNSARLAALARAEREAFDAKVAERIEVRDFWASL